MRQMFIKTLAELATKDSRIMLLTGDLGFSIFEGFRDTYPDRFLNVGTAEQNLMGIAAGLARTGKIVFAYSIATFAAYRAFEQIYLDLAAHKLPVVIVGAGAGLSYAEASISHYALADIALMRTLPDVTVLCPADPVETAWATRAAARLGTPVYLRIGKKTEPVIYTSTPKLALGRGNIIISGKKVAIIACGPILANCLAAIKYLKGRANNPSVISMHTIKPLDTLLIKQLAKTHNLLVTVEEHTTIGGLGSAFAEYLSQTKYPARLLRLGTPDSFILKVGSQQYLRSQIGLSPDKIAKTIMRTLAMI